MGAIRGPGGVGVGFGCPGGVVDDEATLLVASSPPHLDGWERLCKGEEGGDKEIPRKSKG